MIIGRDGPLAVLTAAVDRLRQGRGGFVLVTGEAGIGKTAVLAAAVEHAAAAGMLAVTGTCWDGEGAPGYWPWIQVIRGLERGCGPDDWPAVREAAGDGLGRLLGLAAARPARPASSPAAEADFQVFDAVTAALLAAALRRPVLVVLDDLQWADPASARMLDFVVRHASLGPVLIAAASRDTEIEGGGRPAGPLARAATSATMIRLGGLDAGSVAELVARTAGTGVGPELLADIGRLTGGNPFFVQQAASLWGATGSAGAVVAGLREVIGRRLAALGPGCQRLLRTAALLGTEFDVELAAGASGMTEPAARHELAAAAGAGIVVPGEHGTFRFAHDLVRETIRDALTVPAARERHAAIVRAAGGALAAGAAARGAADRVRTVLPAQLAYHAYLAVPDIPAADAAACLLAAGHDAAGRLAPEEACGHFRRALALIAAGGLPGAQRAAIQLGACQRQAGDTAAARRTFSGVIESARAAGDPEGLARGALGVCSLGALFRDGAGAVVGLADEARARLSEAPEHRGGSPLLAMITAAAARARSHTMDTDREPAERLSAEAVAMARRLGEPESLGFCLLARHDAIWRPGTAAERLAIADEALALAGQTGDRELELQARHLRMVALLESGDSRGLAEQETFAALAERTRWPRFRYLAMSRQAAIAAMQGRFGEARGLADDALALGREIGEVDADGVRHDQVCEIARLQGRQDELGELIAADRAAGSPLAIVVETLRAVDAGAADRAASVAAELRELVEQWPRWAGLMWLACRAQLAEVTGDRRLAAEVRTEIDPVREGWAVLGGAVVIRGPMAHWLAVADAAEGRRDEAVAGFAAAARAADRLGARPWSVLARLELAAALLGRGRPADSAAAAGLLDAVAAEAAVLGMAQAAARAGQLRGAVPAPAGPAGASPAGAVTGVAGPAAARASAGGRRGPSGVFRLDGDVWTLTFADRTALLADAKGLRDLHELLAHPGTPIAAARLLNPAGGDLVTAAARLGADAVLDEQAKASYRARLTELDEEIDAALARRDDVRAASLDAERDALLGELRPAFGLGGRPRRLRDEGERARKTVTARIRDTLRRLDARHPPLAGHLRGTVSTGAYCCYQPPVTVH